MDALLYLLKSRKIESTIAPGHKSDICVAIFSGLKKILHKLAISQIYFLFRDKPHLND